MPPQTPPDESVIMSKSTPPRPEIETLSVAEWVEKFLMPRRDEILTTLANALYEHHIQLAIKKQLEAETDHETSD